MEEMNLPCWQADTEEWCSSCEKMIAECKLTGDAKGLDEKDFQEFIGDNMEKLCLDDWRKKEKDYCKACKRGYNECTRFEDVFSGYCDYYHDRAKDEAMEEST